MNPPSADGEEEEDQSVFGPGLCLQGGGYITIEDFHLRFHVTFSTIGFTLRHKHRRHQQLVSSSGVLTDGPSSEDGRVTDTQIT